MLSDEPETANTIVDFDLLEKTKENVQPLATGRRVTALSALLSTPHAQREAKLASTRNRLRVNVELAFDHDEDGEAETTPPEPHEDPLQAYTRLVYWTLENYPQGHSADSGLLELLEEATRRLLRHRGGCWNGDVRYLKLWLLYASYVERPVDVYRFLVVNEVGTGWGMLYEEMAAVLERDGRKKEADEAYALGIARKAVPLAHLESRYEDFQKRMMSGALASSSAPPPPASSSAVKQRKVLATTATSKSTPPPSASAFASNAASGTNTNSARRVQVFVDPTGDAAAEQGGNAWSDLGTKKERVKENKPEVKKLVGTTIRQAGKTRRVASAASGGAEGRIVPFRDPLPGEGGGEEGEVPVPVPAKSVAKGKEGSSASASSFLGSKSLGSASLIPASTSGEKKKKSASGGFVPFVDSEGPEAGGVGVRKGFVDSEGRGDAKGKTEGAGTEKVGGFRPFVDGEKEVESGGLGVGFTPFRDESAAVGSSAVAMPIGDSIIKVKVGREVVGATSEAEALRKDPLKNYR